MNSIPESHLDLFDIPTVWHVATIGPDGEPHVSPVWADFDGTHVRFPHKSGRQKWKNLESDARVSLSATDPENPERYLEIRGRLVGWESEGALDFLDSMARKYRNEEQFPREHAAPIEDRITGVIKPDRYTSMG